MSAKVIGTPILARFVRDVVLSTRVSKVAKPAHFMPLYLLTTNGIKAVIRH